MINPRMSGTPGNVGVAIPSSPMPMPTQPPQISAPGVNPKPPMQPAPAVIRNPAGVNAGELGTPWDQHFQKRPI